MSELISWLRSAIEGDKAAAERATAGRWAVAIDDRGRWRVDVARWNDYCSDYEVTGKIVRPRNFRDAEHIAIHDPRDTIARCESELALLDKVDEAGRGLKQALAEEDRMDITLFTAALGAFMLAAKALAKGRRHRPGFNPEWVSD